MKDIKIIFMGTPDFSVPVLKGLIEHYNVIAVVSQPDKKVGRKQVITETPVKKVALENSIKVLQPAKVREEYEDIIKLKPDLIVTCAYGQIIPKALLDFPKYGCINVHASLLPKLRGGAPIHKSIINGYEKTGITIMHMDVAMDSGDIITQRKTIIKDEDNLESLHDRLSTMGKELLLETLPSIVKETALRIRQDENEVTYAYNITREEEKLDFSQTSREVFNRIRGLSKAPGAFALLDDKIIKIYKATLTKNNTSKNSPGKIVNIYKDGIGISTSDFEIIINEIKPEGKKEIIVKDYLNGLNKEELLLKTFK